MKNILQLFPLLVFMFALGFITQGEGSLEFFLEKYGILGLIIFFIVFSVGMLFGAYCHQFLIKLTIKSIDDEKKHKEDNENRK